MSLLTFDPEVFKGAFPSVDFEFSFVLLRDFEPPESG